MIIAVVAMPMMQMPSHQIIGMVCVRNRFLPLVVASTGEGDARCRVEGTLGNDVFFVAVAQGRVQMALMEIIDVPLMEHTGMATLRIVDVRVIGMDGSTHKCSSLV
jgi:hypothetical protein